MHLSSACAAEVVAITSSPNKVDTCKAMGADRVIVSSDADAMKAGEKSLVGS